MATERGGRPRAFVTGASSGIGAAFAERLARDGYDLVVVARRRERLEALAQRLQENHGVTVEVMAADLTQPSELQAVERRAAEDTALELLVNNAGFGGYMPFVTLDPDRAEELIRLQVVAVTRLTRAALPGMIARGHGAVINVSSKLAFSAVLPSPPLPKRATYAATKAYINTFTLILHNELKGTGVRVQALCPGIVQTEFHERIGMDPGHFPTAIVATPEDIVERSLAGLRRGKVICAPTLVMERFLGGVAGMVVAALVGMIFLIVLLFILAGSNLGLSDVLVGGLIGGCVGLIFGFCFPFVVGRVLFTFFEMFP